MKGYKIIIVRKNPKKEGYIDTVINELHALQEIVGGLIEPINIGGGILLVINEEGKLLDLERNFDLGEDCMVGNAFFCAETEDGDFGSLTAEQVYKIFRYLDEFCPPKNEPKVGFNIEFF